jgi:Ca2+-binding RTX toxin-like protein
VVEFTLNQMGYTSISGLSTAWDTTTNILDIQFDSANLYVSAYGSNFSVSSGVMALDLDEAGNVSSYNGSVYSAPLGGVVNNDQTNLTVYEKALIKQTFLTIDSLEDLTTSNTVNDTVLIALDALGYSNVSGLVTSWTANTLTSTLSATSVYSDNSAYTGTVNNVNIVVTNDIYGAITSYSNTGTTADGYSFSYTQSNLNNSEVFVIEATNYALNKIDSVTSNDSFTDVDITVTYDELGNLSTYSNSMTHSGVGDVDTGIGSVSSANRAVLESAYNEIASNNTPVPNQVVVNAKSELITGTTLADVIESLGGTNAITAKEGNDTITLVSDSAWASGYVAKNVSNGESVGTQQTVKLDGLNRFSDVIDGGADVDTLILTSGSDVFFLDDIYSAHHESLVLSETSRGTDSAARIINLEAINAGAGDDIVDLTSLDFTLSDAITINGEAGNDTLWSSDANDILNGGTGDDTLFGGAGDDTLTGGTGKDTFQFTASSGNDTIRDFSVSDADTLEFYYQSSASSSISDLSVSNGVITWNTGDQSRQVQIDLSATIVSSDLDDLSGLISFHEIV